MTLPSDWPGRAPRHSGHVSLVQEAAGVRLVDRQGDVVHVLNDTALALWELCDGETTGDEMVDAVQDAFGQPRRTVEAEIGQVLGQLTSAGLLAWSAPDEPEPRA